MCRYVCICIPCEAVCTLTPRVVCGQFNNIGVGKILLYVHILDASLSSFFESGDPGLYVRRYL